MTYKGEDSRMRKTMMTMLVAATCAVVAAQAQQARPASPDGVASTVVGGKWAKTERGQRYEGGKWIEVTYGRPIKRQREDLFGSGADYGKTMNGGAPVWRAGANQSTRLKTEVPLSFGGKALPAGEYLLFVELKSPTEWTLILSSHTAQKEYDENEKVALWGSYGYLPEKDVLRAPMKVEPLPFSLDQFSISFTDMTASSGTLRLMWDKTMGSVDFTVGT